MTTLLDWLAGLLGFPRPDRYPRISLLVPFRPNPDDPRRTDAWNWLWRYWNNELPEAEIVIGRDRSHPYCKTRAVNNAARRARGDIFVILDADVDYLGPNIQSCADRIRAARDRGEPLWFIPYRHVYRLTWPATQMVLQSDPANPLRIPSPPPDPWVESMEGSSHGHRYGAMIQIMPREAFWAAGGMDERFCGWGGEDVSFARAVDTLYGPHKTIEADVVHLWHPQIGQNYTTKMWHGQSKPNVNGNLASRFHHATGDRARMQALVDESRASRLRQLTRRIRRK